MLIFEICSCYVNAIKEFDFYYALLIFTVLIFIDIYSNYAWVVPLKDKKDFIITNSFQIILDKSN